MAGGAVTVIGFIIWSAITLIFIVLAVLAWRSEKPIGFFAGVKPPEVRDIRKYNRGVAILWVCYALLFEGIGVIFLFPENHKVLMVLPLLGIPAISIGLVVAYQAILRRYKANQKENC